MDIRTKLVFALVSVAVVSMLALGLLIYQPVEQELRRSMRERLDGLAEFKVESVEGIVSGWHDRVSLVASRTQLRISLQALTQTGDEGSRARIQRILEDAVSASTLFRRVSIHDLDGNHVAEAESAAGLAAIDPAILPAPDTFAHLAEGSRTSYGGVTFRQGTFPTVDFTAPLVLDDETLGYLHAILVADEVVQLSGNYQGLGKTGETMVVVMDANGTPRALHPLRNPAPIGSDLEGTQASTGPAGVAVPTGGPAGLALSGRESRVAEDLSDYRGQRVWAAIRNVPGTGWGIIVKIDEAEQLQPIQEFRRDTMTLVLSLAAFAIVFGTLIGFQIARPIHTLAEAVRGGELEAGSGIEREDEIGLLARTINEMAGALEDQVGLLTEFRYFFDVSLDLMCIASTDGYFKKVNPAWVIELGWPEEELLKRPFVSFVHEDDIDATVAEIQKLDTGVPTIRFENRFLCMDGSYKRLRWNSYPEPGTGRLYAIARVRPPKGTSRP